MFDLPINNRKLVQRLWESGVPERLFENVRRARELATTHTDAASLDSLASLVSNTRHDPEHYRYFADKHPIVATCLYGAGVVVSSGIGFLLGGEWGLLAGIVAGIPVSAGAVFVAPAVVEKFRIERTLVEFADQVIEKYRFGIPQTPGP